MCVYIWAVLISFVEGIYEHPDPVRTALMGPPGPLGPPWALVTPPWALVGAPGLLWAPWALVGQALVGSNGPLWGGPLWAPWALVGFP